jgi:hypothetical protein
MKGLFVSVVLLVSSTAFAASYECKSSGSGSKTIDAFTVVKMNRGENSTLEFHPVGVSKGWDLSPTSSGKRCTRLHNPGLVAPNGTAEYCPGARVEEFNRAISPNPNEPVYLSAIFVSQGLLQDKDSGYVQIEYRYENGSGAPMHTRKYDCEIK